MPSGMVTRRTDRPAVLEDVEHRRAACARRNLELARLDRVARAEQPGHRAIGCCGARDRRPARSSWLATEASARAFLDRHPCAARPRPGRRPQQQEAASAGQQAEQRRDRISRRNAAGPSPPPSSTREALVPPKPKLLLSAARTWRFLALCGTRSTPAVPSLGLSRLSVGGTIWSRMARMQKIALDRAGAAEQMADRRLGRAHRHIRDVVAEQSCEPRQARARRPSGSRCRGR